MIVIQTPRSTLVECALHAIMLLVGRVDLSGLVVSR